MISVRYRILKLLYVYYSNLATMPSNVTFITYSYFSQQSTGIIKLNKLVINSCFQLSMLILYITYPYSIFNRKTTFNEARNDDKLFLVNFIVFLDVFHWNKHKARIFRIHRCYTVENHRDCPLYLLFKAHACHNILCQLTSLF